MVIAIFLSSILAHFANKIQQKNDIGPNDKRDFKEYSVCRGKNPP